MGFSPTVNQRILPPTFPRYTKIKDRNLSMEFLEALVQRSKQACKIIHCTNYHCALVRHPVQCGNLYVFILPKFMFIFSEFFH